MKGKRPSRNQKSDRDGHAPGSSTKQILIPFIDRYPWTVPLSLFSLSFFFRLHFINDGLFHHDEIVLANAVEGSLEQGRLLGTINGRYGAVILNVLFYAPYKWITGHNAERIIVFTAILSGGLLAAVIYDLVREWCGNRVTAFFSSVFMTFNFLFLTTSTVGKEHTHQILFLALAFRLLRRGARTSSQAFKILGMASFAFAMTVHESTMPLTPVFVACLLLGYRCWSSDWKTASRDLAVLCAVLALPFVLYLGGVLRHTLTVKNTATVSFLGLFSPVLRRATGDLLTATGVAPAILALVGIVANREKWNVIIPAALWVLTIFYYGNTSAYAPRHLILIVLPIAILAGMGAGFITGMIKRPRFRAACGLLLILAVCGYGIYKSYPLISFRRSYCGPKKMAEFVKERTEPEATVITMDESVYIRYYANRNVMTHPVAEYDANREFVERVRTMALSGHKFYVNSTAFTYDYMRYFEKLMVENFHFVLVGEVVDEEYHRPELRFTLFTNRLFRIVPK